MARVRELEKTTERPIGYRIEIATKPNCWICEKEIKEGEIFASSLQKDIQKLCHIGCWKDPEKHGWMY